MAIKGMDTIAQFKVMEYIQSQFEMDSITVSKEDASALRVIDANGDSIVFEYDNGTIRVRN